MARPRRPLSNSASTASCNIRFSLRMMMSGAPSSIRRFKRLLRLITRRYRSFRSEVAKRPPSSGTRGRSSGGMTGMTSRIIHSGRLPDSRNASTTLRRLVSFFFLVWDLVVCDSSRRSTLISSRFSSSSRPRMDSAPMPTVRASSPKWSMIWRYWSSEMTCIFWRLVLPGSSTMYESK